MLRFLQTKGNKNLDVLQAAEELTRGEVVSKNADGSINSLASGVGDYIVDAPKNYTGIYAIVNPIDLASDTIVSGSKCCVLTPMLGERYATSMVSVAGSKVGLSFNSYWRQVRSRGWWTLHINGYMVEITSTLLADWRLWERVASAVAPATKTVTYDANGGAGLMVDGYSPYYQGHKAIAMESTFAAPAYKDFIKWNTVAGGTGTDYAPGDEIAIGASNIALYAQYEDTHTKLLFDENTGAGTMTDSTKYYEDEVIVVPDCALTPPTGKAFSKWNTAANGSGTDYNPEDEITVTSAMIGGVETLRYLGRRLKHDYYCYWQLPVLFLCNKGGNTHA